MKQMLLRCVYLLNVFIPFSGIKNKFKKACNIKGTRLFLDDCKKNTYRQEHILPEEKIYWEVGAADLEFLQYAFPKNKLVKDKKEADVVLKWGMNRVVRFMKLRRKKKVFIVEDSFLRSLTTAADKKAPTKDRISLSFTIDNLAPHFCGNYVSQLECAINSGREFSAAELVRARKCIDKIVGNYLTKYNHQPIWVPEVLKTQQHKVLIIDQSVGDYSIVLGGNGQHRDFEKILADAVRENPNSLIFVKVHPDSLVRKRGNGYGYFDANNTAYKNVTLFAENANPIVILQNVDKVYVWSSGMGFEALMCGKEVITYGTPFYAGWGVTTDRNKLFQKTEMKNRRCRKRSLEELFYFSYIDYSHYVDPDKKQPCEIEIAIDYLLQRRKEYFAKLQIKQEI